MTKHGGGGSTAHSIKTDGDCSVSGTDELPSSDEDEDDHDDDQQQPSQDSTHATDHCITPPTATYLPSSLPHSQIVPTSSSSSPYFMPAALVPDWTDFPPPLPVGVITPAYADYFYPSSAAAAMAGYHPSSAAVATTGPNCPSTAGPCQPWYANGHSQHSLLA